MPHRLQRTIARPAEVTGVGFLTGAEIRLRFVPARPGAGIAFLRTDRLHAPPVPALVEYTIPRQRRTAIQRCGVTIEMIEHVMAALAGLQVDNCLVELDGPEPPGCDGSSRLFAESLLAAGFVQQDQPRKTLDLARPVRVSGEEPDQNVSGEPVRDGSLTISYALDYGSSSPIKPQHSRVRITPETFLSELAWARTFLLEPEAHALRAQGYGKRTTARDLLIFGEAGVIDNEMRSDDECARHKILDCLGDLALIGCDLCGAFEATRSGHALNAEFAKRIKLVHAESVWPFAASKAA